ncbi:MAG: hypothetical protein ACYC6Y_26510 [Thermoguttaceae bacterium]
MNPTFESTRFSEFSINIYHLDGVSYLVCGKRHAIDTSVTRTVFQQCRRSANGLIRSLQQQLRAVEQTTDFQKWFQIVYDRPWDEDHDSRCPFCFLGCRQTAEDLRALMGDRYEQFLASPLKIMVRDLPVETESPVPAFSNFVAGPMQAELPS